jgi:hypothetical protein
VAEQALDQDAYRRPYAESPFQLLITIVGLVPYLVLPTLLQDIIDKTDKWGSDGKGGGIDPFTEIYDDTRQPVLLVLIRMFSVSFSHDRPDTYMPRPGKKRN